MLNTQCLMLNGDWALIGHSSSMEHLGVGPPGIEPGTP